MRVEQRGHFEELPELDAEQEEQGFGLGWVIAITLAVALVGYMFFDGFKSETYFYEVHEAVAQGEALVGQEVRIKGVVEPGTVEGKAGELGRAFRITEEGKSIAVYYDRALPDTFQEGLEVVAHGTVSQDYVLQADEVLVKCPSRYEEGPATEHPASIPKTRASLD